MTIPGQGHGGREALVAEVATEWFLSSVRPHVVVQAVPVTERLVAMLEQKWEGTSYDSAFAKCLFGKGAWL